MVFFRGLDIDDEQQVAIAKTLGAIVQNEGVEGIYKISLDKNVNQRADYLKGSLFWHFDGSLQPYPNLATLLRAVQLSETGGQTEFCNTYAAYDDLPQSDKDAIAELRVVHSAERSQYYVTAGDELRRDHLLAEVADKGLSDRVDTPIRPQIPASRRHGGLRDRIAGRGEPRFTCAPSGLGYTAAVRLSPRCNSAICSSGTIPAPCTARCHMPLTGAGSCTARSWRAKSPCSETRHRHAGRHQRRRCCIDVGEE